MEPTEIPESSPGESTEQVQDDSSKMESWSDEEHSKWLSEGVVPGSEGSASSSESEGDTPEKPSAESEPAKTETGAEKSQEKGKSNAETRKAQLAAEIQELLDARRALRQEVDGIKAGKAAPQPGSQPAPPEYPSKRPVKPKLDQFETYEQYEVADEKFQEEMGLWAAGVRIESERAAAARYQQERQERQASEARDATWVKRREDSTKRNPDWDKVVSASDAPLNPPMNVFIRNSEVGPDLAYYLAKNPREAGAIAAMGPIDVHRALTRIEDRISEGIKSPKGRMITASKPPGTTLGGTNKAPADAAEDALAAGDEGRYIEEMNRRDAARLLRK